ncbi:hypothetical protein PROVRETT_06136 [Providencia rettgeri DSM 1131]|nr:hypothetical protein PROVRETT_06136 [Providencia rettgeri DSM 1131]
MAFNLSIIVVLNGDNAIPEFERSRVKIKIRPAYLSGLLKNLMAG